MATRCDSIPLDMFDLWSLKFWRWQNQRMWSSAHKKLVREKASRETIVTLSRVAHEYLREIEDDIDQLVSSKLCDEARALDVETPLLSDEQMWSRVEDSSTVWLTPKGRSQVRN
jgi:hypothetical protein